jgi:hypothetical protein
MTSLRAGARALAAAVILASLEASFEASGDVVDEILAKGGMSVRGSPLDSGYQEL